ncbi:MAG: C4-type zinc ribbon domain-containing protein [Candidatus Hydrogenedentes bacterium]|nr:C4-type zinc ribbon domain-containing protein [Candidatus Hydrogenedentota bacterium]
MNTLLKLQRLDARINACREREAEIPKQKSRFDIQRARLKAELDEREQVLQDLELEQRDCESEIELRRLQIDKYQQQLNAVRKNDEYQALLHEIDLVNKQIGVKEERILTIMIETDDATARLEEDRKRIQEETKEIDSECAVIDAELAEAVKQREILEAQRTPLVDKVGQELLSRYKRLRSRFLTGTVVVPLRDDVCTGCNMHMRPQIVIEVLQGDKIHSCQQCGRLLYHPENIEDAPEGTEEAASHLEA